MKLELMKNKKESEVISIVDTTEIRFEFFKNMIKKDLEVVCWCNKAVKVFGEFQIYFENSSELNSFDFIVSYLTGNKVDLSYKSKEAILSCKCAEHFLKHLIWKSCKFTKKDLDALAINYTNFLLEATELLRDNFNEDFSLKLSELDEKYFGGNDPTIRKYINPQYLN